MRTGVTVYGPFSGNPSIAPAAPDSGAASSNASARKPGTRTTATSFSGSKATTRPYRIPPRRWSITGRSIPATTCAFVTTRSGAATHPEPSMPTRRRIPLTRTTLSRAMRTSGSPSDARIGWSDVGRRAGDRCERVEARQRTHDPLRRQLAVERREDGRLLRVAAELRLPRDVEQRGSDRPAERQARDRAEDETARVVEGA